MRVFIKNYRFIFLYHLRTNIEREMIIKIFQKQLSKYLTHPCEDILMQIYSNWLFINVRHLI